MQLSPMFLAALPSPRPQPWSLLSPPTPQAPLTVPWSVHKHLKICLRPLFIAFRLSGEHKPAQVMKSYRHSHGLTRSCQREISAELPLLLPLSCTHPVTCQIFMPLKSLPRQHFCWNSRCSQLFDKDFVSLRQKSEKNSQTCSLFLSLRKIIKKSVHT